MSHGPSQTDTVGAQHAAPNPSLPPSSNAASSPSKKRSLFRVGIWEPITTAMILIGLFMLMQPFSQFLFTYSFVVILAGTVGFAIATKLPE